ncbi:hypothetical protein [Candidatus Magnetominusculus dajiuhuensis]|uniref:hypothetical protein n=1 Tax=Candidatus Magnetominusculus dajiuhuensis TaxID=3137712 RepID=UPI003B43A3EA
MGFFSNYGKVTMDKIKNSVIEGLVSFDPEGATEAEIKEMDQKLEEVSIQAAKARQTMLKEKDEAEKMVALYNQRVEAAEILNQKIAAETDPVKKASIEKSLASLIENIEKMSADVDKEKQEAAEAEDMFKYLEQITQDAAKKLKEAKSQYSQAMREMQRAKIQEQMASEKASAAKTAAGLGTDNFNVALKAMKHITEDASAKAEAAKTRSDLLKPASLEEDEHVAAALREVKGEVQPTSLADRLSALKKK